MNLVPLFEEALEFQNYNGSVLSNGKVAVYYIGRTSLADIYNDIEGSSVAENPRILDNLGMGSLYVNPAFDYEMVVYDAYNNELFSVKKYLASLGEHSTANVVVTPSENIAVSAWTVGEVQVYMPYLTGDVGKTYSGIDPIVVNNDVNRISANHIPLGVQEPLYFVEDSETACIIGFSGQSEIPSAVSGKWEMASNAVISNSAEWAQETVYTQGDYISIDDHVISVTGLTPVPTDTASTGLVAGVSADIVAMIPTALTGDYLTKESADTIYQPIGQYQSALDFGYVDSEISSINGSGIYSQGGSANPQIPITSTSGISIFESGDKVYFNISANYATEDWVTGQGYLTAETDWTNTITAASANAYAQATAAIPEQFDPTYLSGQIDNKLDSAIYAAASANFLTALPQDLVYSADIADMATTGDLTSKQDITGMTAYATVESLTAKQDAGNYLSATDSANFLLTSDSANFYPNDNPSAFITGVDLTPYQTIEGMTAYQEAGSYLSANALDNVSGDWNQVSAKLDASVYAADSGSFLTGIPDTYLQNTDLGITDNKVTAISGIVLSAGTELNFGYIEI